MLARCEGEHYRLLGYNLTVHWLSKGIAGDSRPGLSHSESGPMPSVRWLASLFFAALRGVGVAAQWLWRHLTFWRQSFRFWLFLIVAVVVLVIAYFVLLGRTGGTVFQRLFGMKRAANP